MFKFDPVGGLFSFTQIKNFMCRLLVDEISASEENCVLTDEVGNLLMGDA